MVDRNSAPTEEIPPGYPTEALLKHQVAAARELRADLDQLRRQLDDGPPPLSPSRRRTLRPWFGFLAVGAVSTVIAAALLVPWSDLNGNSAPSPIASPAAQAAPALIPTSTLIATPAPSGSAAPGSAAPGSAAPSASAKPSTPAKRSAPAPRSAPGGTLPANGPGIDQPGTMMLVQATKDGSLDVIEQARFGPGGSPQIDLRLPSLASLGGKVAALTPTVRDLRVAVNDTPAPADPTGDGLGWVVAKAGDERIHTVQLSYRIDGAIVRTPASSSGRALGVSLPLLGQTLREQGLPLVVLAEGVQGSAVGGATCPSAPTTKMLCGKEVSGGWLATIPAEASSPALLLQLNLT
ncbi:MAG TPA: hypothetical protein VLL08_26585 [Kineosporiaceae bacterium]|nr:hypothetical protein [Kineosporiaceae bacterium]